MVWAIERLILFVSCANSSPYRKGHTLHRWAVLDAHGLPVILLVVIIVANNRFFAAFQTYLLYELPVDLYLPQMIEVVSIDSANNAIFRFFGRLMKVLHLSPSVEAVEQMGNQLITPPQGVSGLLDSFEWYFFPSVFSLVVIPLNNCFFHFALPVYLVLNVMSLSVVLVVDSGLTS